MSGKHTPDWPKIACTRCGADIYIELIDEGSSWQSYRVVDSISCEKCGAEWDSNGVPRSVAWLGEVDEIAKAPQMAERVAELEGERGSLSTVLHDLIRRVEMLVEQGSCDGELMQTELASARVFAEHPDHWATELEALDRRSKERVKELEAEVERLRRSEDDALERLRNVTGQAHGELPPEKDEWARGDEAEAVERLRSDLHEFRQATVRCNEGRCASGITLAELRTVLADEEAEDAKLSGSVAKLVAQRDELAEALEGLNKATRGAIFPENVRVAIRSEKWDRLWERIYAAEAVIAKATGDGERSEREPSGEQGGEA